MAKRAKSKQSRSTATAPLTGEKQYHIECSVGDVAPYVIMPGDPARVDKFASQWDSAREVAHHREYHTMTGVYQGAAISSTSTGVGSPSLSIAVDELARIGVHTMIRVGSCGGLQKEQRIGDMVISTGAVRLDGASRDLVMPEYPAVANYEVVMALIQAARDMKVRYHVGITASTDTFYTGQGRPAYQEYFPSHKAHILTDLQQARVQNFEMEVATLLTMGSLFGLRTGAICFIIAHRVTDEFELRDEFQVKAGLVASRAVVLLTEWDKKKKKSGRSHITPDIWS